MLSRARAPKFRTMRQFAAEEIVLVEGPFRGRKFRDDRQPAAGLWFDAVDSGLYNRFGFTACVQGGKSLLGLVIPAMYHLFELQETVICGVPSIDLANDKWQEEFRPVIVASRYRDLLPRLGEGSRGGNVKSAIRFRNGVTLKFMSAAGKDSKRSSFTSRVVLATEVDKYDTAGESSREGDPVSQLEARTAAFGDDKRIYLECTVSIEQGRIWQEYTGGTESRIACPCLHCGQYVTPEREHLLGWEAAEDECEAEAEAHFVCPACSTAIDPDLRVSMNRGAVLLHRGQQMSPAGTIAGDPPRTRTLGFRFNAFNNLFWTPGSIGLGEWKAARAEDEENAERVQKQFIWATPWQPPDLDLIPVDAETIRRRTAGGKERGIVPAGTRWLTVGIDIAKFIDHWVIIAWRDNATAHVVEYGVLENDPDNLGVQRGTLTALCEFRDRCLTGWRMETGDARMTPQQVWIDTGWPDSQEVIYQFCRESNSGQAAERFRPIKGHGATQPQARHWRLPTKKTAEIRLIAQDYYIARQRAQRINLVHLNADTWKSVGLDMLSRPADQHGSMTLYDAPAKEHTKFSKHLAAEKPVQKQRPGHPPVIVWETVSRNNHWLDAYCYAAAAAHLCGFRLVAAEGEGVKGGGGEGVKGEGWFAQRKKVGKR